MAWSRGRVVAWSRGGDAVVLATVYSIVQLFLWFACCRVRVFVFLLSLLFCCRCGARFFAVVAGARSFLRSSRGAFFAVVAGARFVLSVVAVPGVLCFAVVALPGAKKSVRRGTTPKKTRTRNDSKQKKRDPQRQQKSDDIQKKNVYDGNHLVLFCCRCGGAFFVSVFAVVAGTGVHSLTGFLGPRNENNNNVKATAAKQKTRVPLLPLLRPFGHCQLFMCG